MDGAYDDMATVSMAHDLLFDTILIFVKYKGYKGGVVKLIIGGVGGGEAVRFDEEGDVSNTEEGRAGVGDAAVFYRLEK